MASQEATLDAKQWENFIKKVQAKWQDVNSGKEFSAIVASVVFADIMDHFAKESGPSGKWTAWSKIYAQHMQRTGKQGNLILQDSGRLRQSFTPTNWRNDRGGIVFYNNAKTKSGFPYAAAHDTGGPKLPKRQFMWLSPTGMVKIIQSVEKWLNPDG
jgi:phage gpG-like protein